MAETKLGEVGIYPRNGWIADYPVTPEINSYYYDQGPPVITYYSPPPDYYYLYGFVPFPFWYSGFWFPGFFVLHDFHRTIFVHNKVVFVSNHFNHIKTHRFFRVDPVTRFNGRTFADMESRGGDRADKR